MRRTKKEMAQVDQLFDELRAVLVKFGNDGMRREACIDVLASLVVNGMRLGGIECEAFLDYMGHVWDIQKDAGPHPAENAH
jgi:hypothetical protein